MELLQKILECKDEGVDLIVREVIDARNSNAQQIDRLVFCKMRSQIVYLEGLFH